MGKIPKGRFTAKITSVEFTPCGRSTSSENDFNIVLGLEDGNGDTETCYLECSQAYGIGNNASKTQLEITMATLASIGWPEKFGVEDPMELGQLHKIINTEVPGVVIEKVKDTPGGEKRVTRGVYIGGRQALKSDEVKARLAALTGTQPPRQPAAAHAQPPPQAF